MFTPTKWVHHFGCSLPWAPRWRRWRRFWCRRRCCDGRGTGWPWSVRCYSCCRYASRPPTAGGTCRATASRSTTRCPKSAESRSANAFRVVHGRRSLYTVWLHFNSRDHGDGRIARAVTAAPISIAAGFMVVVFVGSMAAGVIRQYPTYPTLPISAPSPEAAVWRTMCWSSRTRTPDSTPPPADGGEWVPGAAGRCETRGIQPQRCAGTHCGGSHSDDESAARNRLRLGRSGQTRDAGHQRFHRALPYALNPAQVPMAAATPTGPSRRPRSPRRGTGCLRVTRAISTHIRWWL